MIDPEVLRARYPDLSPPPSAWCGWRRRKDSHDAWEHVPGAGAVTKGGCYEVLLSLSELTCQESLEQHEYMILPAGQQPATFAFGRRR